MVYNTDKRNSVMHAKQADIEHLFSLLQQFLENSHKDIWNEFDLYGDKKPDSLLK